MAGNAPALSERERRFVEAFMGPAAGNATKAAKAAGYSAKSARRIGTRLSSKAHIKAAIKARASNDPAVADRERRQRFWTAVMDGTKPFKKAALKDRIRAAELLGKSQGDFIEHHEHTGKDGAPLSFTLKLTDDATPDV